MNPLFSALSQTWPARAVKGLYEAARHPGEVYAGRADPMDVEKATDLAGLAMTGGLGGLGGMSRQGVVGTGPFRAYHASPYDFDRFDLSKIGTGEGAQAFGHGLYYAGNPSTMDEYFKQFLKHPHIEAMQKAGIEAKPTRYDVAIHADPEKFLDWDKRLKDQSPAVREILNDPAALGLKPQVHTLKDGRIAAAWADETGRPVGPINLGSDKAPSKPFHDEALAQSFYRGGIGSRQQAPQVSEALRQAGIPGIKYLDQGSRTAGDGSRNYVTFSDSIVEILRKYGLVGGLGGLGGMQAMQEPRT
jgi:hypothetical protein